MPTACRLSPFLKGFTLIELMIVIAVVALLTAIAIPNFMSSRDKAKRSSAKRSLAAIRQGFEVYQTHFDTYPAADGDPESTLSRLMPYVTVTNLLSAFSRSRTDKTAPTTTDAAGIQTESTALGFTVQVYARDRFATPVTATAGNVWSEPE